MACGNESLMQKLRTHRQEVLFSKMISAQSTANLVNFARNFIASVEMARIFQSRGTMHIQIRVGDDVLAVFKKIGVQHPQKGLAFIRVLGKLLHNLHIMEYALFKNKASSQWEEMESSYGENVCLANGNDNSSQVLDDDSAGIRASSCSWAEAANGLLSEINAAESDESLGVISTFNNQSTDSVGRFSDVVADFSELVPSSSHVTPSSYRNSDVKALSTIVTKSVIVHNRSNGSQPKLDQTTQAHLNKVLFHKLSEMQISRNESSLCHHFVARSRVCQVVTSAGSTPNISSKTDASSEFRVVRQETVLSKGSANSKCAVQPHLMPCENSGSDSSFNAEDTRGLELVAVGGQTVELPVGETIQVLPYSSVIYPEQDSMSSKNQEPCPEGQQNRDHLELRTRQLNDNEFDLPEPLENPIVTDCCGDDTQIHNLTDYERPRSKGSPSPDENMWSYRPDEHIEHDTHTGKTFFSL